MLGALSQSVVPGGEKEGAYKGGKFVVTGLSPRLSCPLMIRRGRSLRERQSGRRKGGGGVEGISLL